MRKPSEYINARNLGKPYLQAYETPPILQILELVLDKEQHVTKTCELPIGNFQEFNVQIHLFFNLNLRISFFKDSRFKNLFLL
jgi:hypothetical protein